MNEINFLAKDDFPASSDTLSRLQEATNMVANLTLLGGSNYILTGCDEKAGKIEPGVIVLGGKIYPFLGGDILEFVIIQETKKTLEFDDELYPEAYIDRVAVFSADGKFKWGDLKKILNNQQLAQNIDSLKGETPGFVKSWSGLIERLDKEKYLLCDGATVLTVDYPQLAWYYGKENESSFKLPDLRKRFIVGYDNASDDYNEIGKKGGEEFHALTIQENAEHRHIVPWGENLNSAWIPEWGYPPEYFNNSRGYKADTDNDNTWPYSSPSGEGNPHENRPPFYTLAYVVRVKY